MQCYAPEPYSNCEGSRDTRLNPKALNPEPYLPKAPQAKQQQKASTSMSARLKAKVGESF